MIEQGVKIPADFRKALIATLKAQAAWKDLTPIARRDFITWIEGAKQEETRKRRIEKARDMLLSGKRRPCCYAVTPVNLYKALGTDPKAQAAWKGLTPDERRDFVAWIGEAKDTEAKGVRIMKTCTMLAKGKRHP